MSTPRTSLPPKGGIALILSDEEYEAVLRTRLPLLLYAARKLERNEDLTTVEDLGNLTPEEGFDLSVTMCNRGDIIDDYVEENPDGLTGDDLALVSGYRHARYGKFVMLKHLKRHTVLLGPEDPPVAYGLVGLREELSDILPDLPALVETVLLPLGERITFDGVILGAGVTFGPGVRRSFGDSYREAKARFGVVTSLPFTVKERPDADVERLKAMTRSWKNVGENREAIREIISKDHALLVLYHQRLGVLAARDHRKGLKDEGITEGWFATLDGTLVGGATTREDVERTVEALVPGHKHESVHIYKARGK